MTVAADQSSYRLEILTNALTAITEEIQLTILRTAYSHNVKEGHELLVRSSRARARLSPSRSPSPVTCGSMKFMLAEILKVFPAQAMKPGDVFITNDPYRGGSHLPDIGMYRPVFHGGTFVAFTGCLIHHTDVGGMVPGSNPVRATELYQEGLVIPATKLMDGGVENAAVTAIIRANVRQPDITFGDLHAQESALLKGEKRLHELFDRYGVGPVTDAMEGLIAYSERRAREAIRALPDGVYEFEDFMDHDGIDLSKPIRIKVTLTVRGDTLEFDFTGTDPQVRGPDQCAARQDLDDDLLLRELRAAAGRAVQRRIDACCENLCAGRHDPQSKTSGTGHRPDCHASASVDVVHGALAQAAPDKVGAQCSGTTAGVSFGGIDPRTSKSFVFYEAFCGGTGATSIGDGEDGVSTGTSNPQLVSAEAIEMAYPVRIRRVELSDRFRRLRPVPRWAGDRREYEMLAEYATMNVRSERSAFAPRGLNGGKNGNTSTTFFAKAGEKPEQLPSKFSGHIDRGGRLVVATPGAGGFGDTQARSHDRIKKDWLDGRIRLEKTMADFEIDVTKLSSD